MPGTCSALPLPNQGPAKPQACSRGSCAPSHRQHPEWILLAAGVCTSPPKASRLRSGCLWSVRIELDLENEDLECWNLHKAVSDLVGEGSRHIVSLPFRQKILERGVRGRQSQALTYSLNSSEGALVHNCFYTGRPKTIVTSNKMSGTNPKIKTYKSEIELGMFHYFMLQIAS